jgi:hypothetical protein
MALVIIVGQVSEDKDEADSGKGDMLDSRQSLFSVRDSKDDADIMSIRMTRTLHF